MQAFVASESDCEERGTAIFCTEEVHKIAILDIRIANCDRNGGNILVQRREGDRTCGWTLVPIDHGYCLPSSFADLEWEWRWWPQVTPPLCYLPRGRADWAAFRGSFPGRVLHVAAAPSAAEFRITCTERDSGSAKNVIGGGPP